MHPTNTGDIAPLERVNQRGERWGDSVTPPNTKAMELSHLASEEAQGSTGRVVALWLFRKYRGKKTIGGIHFVMRVT